MLALSAALAACGADDEPVAPDPGRTVTDTVAPPSTTPPDAGSKAPGSTAPGGQGAAGAQEDPANGEQPGGADREPAAPGAPAPAAATSKCGDVTITPNSGDGAFDVRATGIGCAEAERLIKSPDGLTTWGCRPVDGGGEAGGSQTIRCRDAGRMIVFETGV